MLYVKAGRCVFEYVYSESVRHVIRSDASLPTGPAVLRYEFTRTGPRRGHGALFVDGKPAGSAEIPKTWPIHATAGGVFCGRDGGAPVSDAYPCPFTFTGTIHRVVVELGSDGTADARGAARHALVEE